MRQSKCVLFFPTSPSPCFFYINYLEISDKAEEKEGSLTRYIPQCLDRRRLAQFAHGAQVRRMGLRHNHSVPMRSGD